MREEWAGRGWYLFNTGSKGGLEIQIGYNTYIHWVDGFYIGTVPEPVGIGPYLLTMSFQRVTKSFVLWPFPWDATLGKDELEPKKKGSAEPRILQ